MMRTFMSLRRTHWISGTAVGVCILFLMLSMAPLGFRAFARQSKSTIDTPIASHNFTPISTSHTSADYLNGVEQTFIDAEGVKTQVYDDGTGIPTIGVGYNLTVRPALDSVVASFGAGPTKLSTLQQQAALTTYIDDMAQAIDAYSQGDSITTLQADLAAILAQIRADATFPIAFRNGVQQNFAFTSPAAAKVLFSTIYNDLNFEQTLTRSLGSNTLDDSLERAALISLVYNGLTLRGGQIVRDLVGNNRAQVWYDIRYATDANNNSQKTAEHSLARGVAIRRDYESDLFGLYDGDPFTTPSVVTNDEANQIFAVILAHEGTIYQSVIPVSGQPPFNNQYYFDPDTLVKGGTINALTRFDNAISAVEGATTLTTPEADFTVRVLSDDLAPAADYLLTNSTATGAGNVLVFQQTGPLDLSAYGATGIAAFVQNSGTHTITMNSGSDLLYTDASDTILLGSGVDQLSLRGTTTTVDTSQLTQAADPNLLLDNITFGGAVISTDGSSITSGSTDSYGRTYTLSGGVLTITQGSSSVTIKGFESGDFGVDIQSTYTFTKLNVPTNSRVYGINDARTIVGGGQYSAIGFRGMPGKYTTFDYQTTGQYTSGDWDVATSINNKGQMVGYSANTDTIDKDSWLFSNGKFSNVVVRNSQITSAYGINDNGEIVGQYADNSGLHGFLYTPSTGTPSTLDELGSTNTDLLGINDSGQIVGNNSLGSFLYTPGPNGKPGTYAHITTQTGGATYLIAINNKGQVLGYSSDQQGEYNFISDGTQHLTKIPLPTPSAFPVSINDSGDILFVDIISGASFLGVSNNGQTSTGSSSDISR